MTRNGSRVTVRLGALGVVLVMCACVHYDSEVKNALKRAFANDFPHYTFRGTPVGDFGAGTMYLKDIENPKGPVDENWLAGRPSTWFVEGVTEAEQKSLNEKIIVEGDLGSKALTEDISSKLGLSFTLPVLKGLLSLDPSVDLEKGVKVSLKASKAINRRMDWPQFEDAVSAGKIRPGIAARVRQHAVLIGADDLVLIGYKATVTIDQNVNPTLDAKLNDAVGKVLGKDTSLKLKIGSSAKGTYEVEAQNPVVAAVLYKEAPTTVAFEGKTELAKWHPVTLKPDVLTQLEMRIASH